MKISETISRALPEGDFRTSMFASIMFIFIGLTGYITPWTNIQLISFGIFGCVMSIIVWWAKRKFGG